MKRRILTCLLVAIFATGLFQPTRALAQSDGPKDPLRPGIPHQNSPGLAKAQPNQVSSQLMAANGQSADWRWVKSFSNISEIDGATLAVFKGYLYAGYSRFNDTGPGAQIWRTKDGKQWEPASIPAFGNILEPAGLFHATYFHNLFVFRDKLYAGLGWWYSDNATFWEPNGGQLWRTGDGLHWEKVLDFANDPHNENIVPFASFRGMLYAATVNWFEGFQVWRSPTGNSGDWTKVADHSLGTNLLAPGNGMLVYKDKLFLIEGDLLDENYSSVPPHIWYTRDGVNWTPLTLDGFGDPQVIDLWSVNVYRGDLYVELNKYDAETDQSWIQVMRISPRLDWEVFCDHCRGTGSLIGRYFYMSGSDPGPVIIRSKDLVNWQPISQPGFGDPTIIGIAPWLKFKGELYAVASTPDQDYQIWRGCLHCKE